MSVSIVKRLDDALDAMSANPTKAEVRACFRQVLRFIFLTQLDVGNTEKAQTIFGDLIEPSPEGAMREMLDRNYRFDLTGEHHPDGAPISDPNLPVRTRQELPPGRNPRERGAGPGSL